MHFLYRKKVNIWKYYSENCTIYVACVYTIIIIQKSSIKQSSFLCYTSFLLIHKFACRDHSAIQPPVTIGHAWCPTSSAHYKPPQIQWLSAQHHRPCPLNYIDSKLQFNAFSIQQANDGRFSTFGLSVVVSLVVVMLCYFIHHESCTRFAARFLCICFLFMLCSKISQSI